MIVVAGADGNLRRRGYVSPSRSMVVAEATARLQKYARVTADSRAMRWERRTPVSSQPVLDHEPRARAVKVNKPGVDLKLTRSVRLERSPLSGL